MKTRARRVRLHLRGWASVAALTFCGVVVVAAAKGAFADDATNADSRLAALDRDDAHKAVTQETRDRARAAIERSKRFRAAGDETHAKLSDRAAITWIAAGEDLTKTADAEAQAEDVRRAAMDAGAQAERERALLEETMLQNGRLRAELDQVTRDVKPSETSPVTETPKATPTDRPRAPAKDAKDGGAR